MRDQDLIDLACPRIPDEWRRKYLARSVESLPNDVTTAFDRIYKLEREKDQLRNAFEANAKKTRRWLALLSSALIVSIVLVVLRLLLQ